MLEVKIDMIPCGNEKERRTIGVIKVFNTLDNRNRPDYGNYSASFSDPKDVLEVRDHLRSDGVYVLLESILQIFNRKRKKERNAITGELRGRKKDSR